MHYNGERHMYERVIHLLREVEYAKSNYNPMIQVISVLPFLGWNQESIKS